jgi:integrase/recombinase XerD
MTAGKGQRMSEQVLTAADVTELDVFIDHLWLEDGLAKNTLESYRLDLSAFSLWLTKQNKQLLTVDQADIQQYLAVRFPQSKARSISRLIASLRRFYRYLMRDNKISLDPTIQIQSPKLPRSLPKSLNEDEVLALLDAPNLNESAGLRDRAMLELLYACGLRVSELVGVKVTEVSINDGVVRVTGKGSKTRLVPMGEEAVDWISRYLSEARPDILQKRLCDALFVTNRGQAMTRQAFWYLMSA